MHNSSDDSEWGVRPGGMLVQRRDDTGSDQHSKAGSSRFMPAIKISVSHGSLQRQIQVPDHATFGDVKKAFAQKTGLEPVGLKILFRGQEKEDAEQLHTVGVKDNSKLVIVEDSKKNEEQGEQQQQPELTEEMAKALAAVAGIRAEVDMLSERVTALGIAVNGGTKVAVEEFDMSAELLMRQLLKLDSIEAEGEARVQRKAEVRRVQNFHEILDNLKARNSNPFVDHNKAVSVTTEWEAFDKGVGSLDPPLPPSSSSSSAKITQDWEQFDEV